MSSLRKFGFYCSLSFLILNSCATIENEDQSDDPKLSGSKNIITPGNSENELDFAGEDHNSQLIEFVDSYLLRDSIESDADVFNYFDTSVGLSEMIQAHYDMFREDPIEFERICSEVYNADPVIHDYFIAMKEIARNSNLTLAQKIEDIKEFEHGFDYDIYPTNVQECLKVMSSVARFSLFLWAPAAQGGLGYNDKITGYQKKIDWWEVGVDDIFGTAAAGVFAPTPVTALAGGVIASGWTAFKQW